MDIGPRCFLSQDRVWGNRVDVSVVAQYQFRDVPGSWGDPVWSEDQDGYATNDKRKCLVAVTRIERVTRGL